MEKLIVTLEAAERRHLEEIVSKGTHAAAKLVNALILLNCNASDETKVRRTSAEIAGMLHVGAIKIDHVKRRFVEDGIDAALGRRDSARQYERKIDGDLEAHLIALACSKPPVGRGLWSLRLLADIAVELDYVASISHETVRRTLKKRTQALEKSRLGNPTLG